MFVKLKQIILHLNLNCTSGKSSLLYKIKKKENKQKGKFIFFMIKSLYTKITIRKAYKYVV